VRKGRVELSMRAEGKGRLVAALLEGMGRSSGAGSSGRPPSAAAALGVLQGSADAGGGGGGVFVLTAGDDVTDEEMFSAARKWAAQPVAGVGACHVVNVLVGRPAGRAASAADSSLASVGAMQDLLVALHEAAAIRTGAPYV
jgi:trehalose-6-phosphatase